jgi:hypothetical protein
VKTRAGNLNIVNTINIIFVKRRERETKENVIIT